MASKSGIEGNKSEMTLFSGPIQISNTHNGPDNDECIGLNLEDMKRRRSGPKTKIKIDTEIMGFSNIRNTQTEVVLSKTDCSAPSQTILVKLAKQASQLQ